MEDKIHTQQMITTPDESGKVSACVNFEGKRELMEPVWNPLNFRLELRVLAWTISLCQDHPDFGFFHGGGCKKCSGCSDEFNFLHYTSEKNAYCVRCYISRFCDVVENDTIFQVVIKRSGRILIEIHDPNQNE